MIAVLLILIVVSSLCLGSTTPTTAQPSPQGESVAPPNSSTSLGPSNSSACQSCTVSHNGTQTASGGVNSTPIHGSENETAKNSTSQAPGNSTVETSSRTSLNVSLIKFYVYGSENCCRCRHLLAFLTERYGNDSVVFYDIEKGSNGTVLAQGFLDHYPDMNYLPIVGIAYNGTLVAIVSGFSQLFNVEDLIKLSLRYKLIVMEDPSGGIHYAGNSKRALLEEVFIHNRLPSGS
jgi:hypothetical protein